MTLIPGPSSQEKGARILTSAPVGVDEGNSSKFTPQFSSARFPAPLQFWLRFQLQSQLRFVDRSLSINRQQYLKSRAFAQLTLHRDRATAVDQQLLDDR